MVQLAEPGDELTLYGYFQSSAAYRVRLALSLKRLDFQQSPIDLLSRQALTGYQDSINPQGLVPALATADGLLTQSLAIIEYLDEVHPEPSLLPAEPHLRAYVRAVAQLIACDIHPLANLRVLRYLKRDLGHDQATINNWYRHWVEEGLTRLEAFVVVEGRSGRHVLGDQPTIADCLIVPQLFNARRLDCDLTSMPTLVAIDAKCTALPEFHRAHPSEQPDAR